MAYARKQQNYKTMELIKKEGYGVQALKVTINIADAIAISNLLGKLDEYEKQLAARNAWLDKPYDPETGASLPEPEDPNAEGKWNPQDFIVKARIILKKFAFVKSYESNIFDEEVVAEEPRKAYK